MAASVALLRKERKSSRKVSAQDRLWPRLIQTLLPETGDGLIGDQPAGNEPADNMPVDGAETRAETRRPVRIAGHVELEQGEVQDCLILDLSPSGALIQVERAAAVGETIKLRLTENGEFAGTVRWRGARSMGVKFDHFGGLLPS